MKRLIVILGGLLVLQIMLAAVLNLGGEDYEAFQAKEKLLSLNAADVDHIRIQDEQQTTVLQRRDDQWLLPDQDGFPTAQGNVKLLLDKLGALQRGWPVATTAGAAKRFKVSEEIFERKITLSKGDKTQADFYMGTSPGFRKVHVRAAGESEIHAVEFAAYEASASPDDWIDKAILQREETDIVQVEMPDFSLRRDGDQWLMSELGEGEETREDEARSLIGKLAGLQIQSVLGTEIKPEYGQDSPDLEFTLVLQDARRVTYRFSKPKDETYFVLKTSDRDHYFKVAEFTVDPIKEMTPDKLVHKKSEEDKASSVSQEQEDAIETQEDAS